MSGCRRRFSRTEAAAAWGGTSQVERVGRVLRGPCPVHREGLPPASSAHSPPTCFLTAYPQTGSLCLLPCLISPLPFLPLINPPPCSPITLHLPPA